MTSGPAVMRCVSVVGGNESMTCTGIHKQDERPDSSFIKPRPVDTWWPFVSFIDKFMSGGSVSPPMSGEHGGDSWRGENQEHPSSQVSTICLYLKTKSTGILLIRIIIVNILMHSVRSLAVGVDDYLGFVVKCIKN